MQGFRKKLAFPALCLAVGLVVFSVSYTMLGQGPGLGPGESDTQEPVGNTGAGPGGDENQPPGNTGGGDTGGESPPGDDATPSPPTEVPDELQDEQEDPGPVGQVNELFDVLADGDVSELKQLLEDGVDPNAKTRGVTPLSWAVVGMETTPTVYAQVKTLLAAGADPNITDNVGRTALHYAAQYGGSDAVTQALIDGGVGVDIKDQHGVSALQLATMLGNDGARSALEAATTIRPPEYDKLKTIGTFSKKLKAATTEEEKKAIVEREAASMVERGWMTEEERKALLQAIENLGD